MINQEYKKLLGAKSVIREMFMYGKGRAAEIGYENVFDYSLGNPSVPCPPEFTQAMIDLLQNNDPMTLHGYCPSQGDPTFRQAVAESISRRFGIPYKAQHIFPTTGAAGAIAHAVRAVTVPGDEVLTFAPFFPEYMHYINQTGAVLRVVPADTQSLQINFEKLDEMLTEKVKVILINTPNNPSGIVYNRSTLMKLGELLREKSAQFGHTVFLVSDEPYREICFSGVENLYPASFYENTLTCYSFSKSLSLPGERLGYVAVHPQCEEADILVDVMTQISRGIGHNCPPSIIQQACARCLHLTSDLSIYERNMEILYAKLVELGFEVVKPGGTFYIFPKALEEDSVAFCERAKQFDLLLVPGDSFGCPGYFRMAYCIDTEKVKRSLPALEALAASYRK